MTFPSNPLLVDDGEIRGAYLRLATAGLDEDLGFGPDITTLHSVVQGQQGSALMRAREGGVVSGMDAVGIIIEVARERADQLGGTIELRTHANNGDKVAAGDTIAEVAGDLRALLQLERTMLNVVSHASGIATETRRWIDATGIAIRDSRKTLPGLRMLQKRAVMHGGGTPHRWGLGDQAMIKDNHVASGGLVESMLAIREAHPNLWLEVEVDTLERSDILQDLRSGVYDVLVGINLLREGLDLPEVSLVAIIDADKEGFLRSTSALIQTIGRAARHLDGQVLMYADKVTDSMKRAIDETSRRRALQTAYNTEHGITPTSVAKALDEGLRALIPKKTDDKPKLNLKKIPKDEYASLVKDLSGQMDLASANLEFEKAAELRDLISEIRSKM